MSAATRIAGLRLANPAAADLARVCALAARVEPPLLRRLRLLVPHADATAEADLWFSDLLAGRDATALAIDPLVAEALRDELRRPELAALREDAAAEIARAHAGAHWSVRLEERIHYLHVAGPPDADDEIDDLLLAALEQLRTEPDPRGIARWLLGAAGRLPRPVTERTAGRASAAAAMLHLDRQAPAPALLNAGESQAWLPWLADALPRVSVPVRLLDGAVVLGASGPDTELLPDVPDTDPLVIEVRWSDGIRAASQRARFRLDAPVQVETGTSVASLVTLTGATYELADTDSPASAGLRFDHLKQNLRPCLGRENELRRLSSQIASPVSWIDINGRPGSGTSTLLVAAADAARATGAAVIEHFLSAQADAAAIDRSFLAQLEACYPNDFRPLPPTVTAREFAFSWTVNDLQRRGAIYRRPLVIVLDGFDAQLAQVMPKNLGDRVSCLTAQGGHIEVDDDSMTAVVLTEESDRRVCLAMIERDRPALERAFVGPVDGEVLANIADNLPGMLAKILSWVARQPDGTVSVDTIPVVLTWFWPGLRRDLDSQFGELGSLALLDTLRSAHGRHTWEDCARRENWPQFWEVCRSANLVTDIPPDGIVELTEPSAAELLLHTGRAGDHFFGLLNETPSEFAWTASPTRLAAAVGHLLAVDDLKGAQRLCTDLPVLRRRYAEDATGLLADLEAVEVTLLRSIVHGLHKNGVPPAEFAAALYNRLAEHGSLAVVPGFADEQAPLPPLRVRSVTSEADLRNSAPVQTNPGPVLAIARLTNTPFMTPADPDGVVLITEAGMSTIDGTRLASRWPGHAIGAARGSSGGFAVWTTDTAWIDTMLDTGLRSGTIDHAVRLDTVAAVADPSGGVLIMPMPGFSWRLRPPRGHGARVTAIMEWSSAVVVAYQDGTIRMLFSEGSTLTFAGHRAAVRAVIHCGQGEFVSGGDDGCLLHWRYDEPGHPIGRLQGAAAITSLTTLDDDTVVFGTADGQVATWNTYTGESTTIGSHVGPVRGIAALSGSQVVSWSGSVRFWNPPSHAIGFPGVVRDVIVGDTTYTVLCGDGSVQRRPRPDLLPVTEHPERGCLEIIDNTVYTGLDENLLRIPPSGPPELIEGGPFVQAAPLNGGAVAVIDLGGRIRYFPPQAPPDDTPDAVDLIAANRVDRVVTATGDVINAWEMNTAGNLDVFNQDLSRVATRRAPARVTSLAMSPLSGLIAAGLSNGEVMELEWPLRRGRTLSGQGTPVTVVAQLWDWTVVTGSTTGIVQCWPADSAHGPVTFPRRSGAITAMAVTNRWLITAGEDGVVVLWATEPPRPVHEINLGAPVIAVAAEDELAAARDANGRLWTFDLESQQTGWLSQNLSARMVSTHDGFAIYLEDPSTEPYELTAIRVSIDGKPTWASVRAPWPRLEADGTLTVPTRPIAGQPLALVGGWSHLPMNHDLKVTIDFAARLAPGYRTSHTLDVYLTDPL